MAALTSQDRLQPSLLDRLTDHDSRSGKESIDDRVLTRQQLRAAVLRDLSWLFNTTRIEPEPNSSRRDEIALWKELREARSSVLNFGLPAFAGETLSSLDLRAIERGVRGAIVAFEPRINAATLSVEVSTEGQSHHNAMQLVIRGQMWNQPVPLELLLAADVDVETGSAQLRDLRH